MQPSTQTNQPDRSKPASNDQLDGLFETNNQSLREPKDDGGRGLSPLRKRLIEKFSENDFFEG